MDKLDKLFEMQEKLNDNIFRKQNICNNYSKILTSMFLYKNGRYDENQGPNDITNKWLIKFLDALDDESRELREELLWKWWSKDTLNMQNIRVEIIDQLHFWICLAMTAGMDAQKVYDIYMQKNKVNLERQENRYSKATKTEDDNKGVK